MSGRDERAQVQVEASMRMVAATAGVLIVALAFQVAGLAEPVTLVLVLAALAALLWAHTGLRIVRTSSGPAFVHLRRGEDGEPVRVLRQGGVYQSATYLGARRFEPVFAYHRAFDVLFSPEVEGALHDAAGHGAQRVLALGGGGYAWPKHALMEHDDLAMDVIEVDPAVVHAARKWFYVAELEERVGERLHLVVADGRAFLEERAAEGGTPRYDAVVNDTFVGRVPVRALATVEAARAAKACLVPGGVYLANVVSADDGVDLGFLRDEVATLGVVFAHVHVLPATDEELGGEDNYLVVATDSELALPDAIPFDKDFLGTPLHDA